jgi:hypothetical protein
VGRLANIPRMMFAANITALFLALVFAAPASAEPGLEGVTGLLNIPTAEVLKDGEVTLGFGRNENNIRFPGRVQRNYYAGLGFLPRLEISARYIDFPEINDPGIPGFGTRKDRSVNAKFQLLSEDKAPLSLAVGMYDVAGRAVLERGGYAVATKTAGDFQFTLGVGEKRLDGVFGGVSYKPAREVELMYEFDTYDSNYGVRFNPHPDWHITMGSVAGDFTYGVSFTKTLPSSRNPKPKREGVTLARQPAMEGEASAVADLLAIELAQLGLENVRVGINSGVLDVEYENRRYRNEEQAWAFVCDWAAKRAPADTTRVCVRSLRGQRPVVSTSFVPADLLAYVNGEMKDEEFAAKADIIDGANGRVHANLRGSSVGSTDLFFVPACTLDLGRAFQPVRQRSGIAIEHSTSLGSGFSLTSREEIPISNNLDNQNSPFIVRGMLNHSAPWGGGWYSHIDAGYYNFHRWGGQAEIRKYWDESRYDLGVNAGIVDNSFSDSVDEQFQLSGSARIPSLDLTLSGTTGRFIWGDEGFRLSANRRLGAYSVEFFYLNTTYTEDEAGVRVSIPLFGYSEDTSGLRAGVAPVFNYEYRTSSAHRGELLFPGGSISEYRAWLYPWHLRENFYLLREAAGGILQLQD